MGWENRGQSLAGMVRQVKDAVGPAIEVMVDDGGQAMQKYVIENTPVETGELRASIRQKAVVRIVSMTGTAYESGAYTEVIYALYVEEGTGLWGPHHAKYRIEPKDPNGVLAFYVRVKTPEGKPQFDGSYHVAEGNLVFAKYVMHPGSPGQHMFAIGAAQVDAQFDHITGRGLEEWVRRSEG